MLRLSCLAMIAVVILLPNVGRAQSAEQESKAAVLEVGKDAPDFELKTSTGDSFKLSNLRGKSSVVLVVLRGFPGYQCPICSRQVGDLLSRSTDIEDQKAQVVLVYPGPKDEIEVKAKEFFAKSEMPKSFTILLDPDYGFTNAYGLRWDAPRETAYPTTMVIDAKGIIRFLKSSKSHGDRVAAKVVLTELESLKK